MDRYAIAQKKNNVVKVTLIMHCSSDEEFRKQMKNASEYVIQRGMTPGGCSMGVAGPEGRQDLVSCFTEIKAE